MSENIAITEPVILDRTGQRIADALEGSAKRRVFTLDNTPLVNGGIVEAVGIPTYVSDVTSYSAYGLTETGWYVFARIKARGGEMVTGGTVITGAAGSIKTIGNDYVDVAVKFDVAAQSALVTIKWDVDTEAFVFRANDLAVRNLDYRSTFYVYDISEFATWNFAQTTDATFAENKNYYTKSGTKYTKATVTASDPVPAYYEQVISYALTTDETFQDGKTYYTKDGDEYTAATVTTGEAVTADTYYEQTISYVFTSDTTFQESKTYYTLSEGVYSEATVTAGEAVPAYYTHSKLTFAGMTRNVTYRLDDIVDCPIEIVLPEVPDDGYGAWFEIQMQFSGSSSITLLPEDSAVKIGTATTQGQTAGINIVDLQYSDVGDVKMWTLLNTHSNIPAAST